MEVFAEFLWAIQRTISAGDEIVPVLRGSILLSHWFGDAARVAGDMDLEWFPTPDWGRRSASPIEQARKLCMCAATEHAYHQSRSPVSFVEDSARQDDGVSLWNWDYGTPGLRCFTGWTWEERNLRGDLQIDLALAAFYDLTGIAMVTVELPRAAGDPVEVQAYAPEMLLAAKLSWIIRSVGRKTGLDGIERLTFSGEPKDLFDAHLLVTKGLLRPEVFQSAFLSVAMEDKIDGHQLDLVLDSELPVFDGEWASEWPEFFQRYSKLLEKSPGDMLRTISDQMRLLIGNLREHLPFLRSIADDPIDETSYMIYADWLEDCSDPRSDFLRTFCRFEFHNETSERDRLFAMLTDQPGGWLYHVFGSPERAIKIRKRLEAPMPAPQSASEKTSHQRPSASGTEPAGNKPWWKFW